MGILWEYGSKYEYYGIKKDYLHCQISGLRSMGFWRIKNIPAQDLPVQLGPKNVHNGKTHFRDINTDIKTFEELEKYV